MKRPLKATLTITRSQVDEEHISMDIRDVKSTIQFATLRVSLAEFARAITGGNEVPCHVDVRSLELVGSRHETVTRRITLPRVRDLDQPYEDCVKAACVPYERYGWRACPEDTWISYGFYYKPETTSEVLVPFARNVPSARNATADWSIRPFISPCSTSLHLDACLHIFFTLLLRLVTTG